MDRDPERIVKRRFVAVLLVLAALFGISVATPPPARAADGIFGNIVERTCKVGSVMNWATLSLFSGGFPRSGWFWRSWSWQWGGSVLCRGSARS
ncbi:hypothetical protein ACN20G_36670 (plasmid) [Streptomyces sp. BI20]|uniref:hypothetical protein n=1 Tax=Streptomyces sp. BI20 TaxID=3403460 RepID=UPI003C76C40B